MKVDYKNIDLKEVVLSENEKKRRLNKQFVDADYGMSQIDYNKWLKRAKKTYIHTIETSSLLMGETHSYKDYHKCELYTKAFGNLNPYQIIRILDSIDVYTIMKIISNDLEIKTINNDSDNYIIIGNCVLGDGSNLCLYSLDGTKRINGINAYELLYKFLRLPIGVVLSSINEVNLGFDTVIPFDEDLCQKIDDIQCEEENRKVLVRKKEN